jgi:hypothetical protein
MKHTNELNLMAQKGLLQEALSECDALLCFAPKNTKALLMKAKIHDSRGEFNESFEVVKKLSNCSVLDAEEQAYVYKTLREENEVQWHSELSQTGRIYYSDTKTQLAISFVGLLGCLFFLYGIRSPWGNLESNFNEVLIAFLGLVCVPWLALIWLYLTKIRFVNVGVYGISVRRGFSSKTISWRLVDALVVEHAATLDDDFLSLQFYSATEYVSGMSLPKIRKRTILLHLNLSKQFSVVKARRHFLRNVLNHSSVVLSVPKRTQNTEKTQKALNENDVA